MTDGEVQDESAQALAPPEDPRARATATLNLLAESGSGAGRVALRGLSGLTSRQFAEVAPRWQALPTARRRRLTREMVDLAEDNVEFEFNALFRVGLRDDDAEVRRLSIDGLWEADDRSLADEYVRLALHDPAVPVRTTAASALGRFTYQFELGKLNRETGERVRDALLALTENETEPIDVRRRALESLAFLNEDEVHDLIADAYRNGDERLRASAIFAMGRSVDPAWLTVLTDELHSANAEHRYEAARATGEMEDAGPVPDLIGLLNDPDSDVRLAAVQALGQIGGTAAKRALRETAQGADVALAAAAEEAIELANFGDDPIAFRLERRDRGPADALAGAGNAEDEDEE